MTPTSFRINDVTIFFEQGYSFAAAQHAEQLTALLPGIPAHHWHYSNGLYTGPIPSTLADQLRQRADAIV